MAYTLVAVLLGFFQRKLLYHPRKEKPLLVEADLALMKLYPDAKDVRLTCADGIKIGAWLLTKTVGPDDDRRPLIIYFHGNANNRASRAPWYQIFAEIEADVLAIDYHGYGDSEGTMTEGGMYQSCDAAWGYATEELQYAPSEIILAGTSLGGAAAVYTAAQQTDSVKQPAALVVTATFSSMVDVAASLYPWLPVSSILVDRYPSADRISNVKCPIVIIHGNADRLVHTKHGQTLFDAAPAKSESGQPKRWKTLDGIGHNGLVRLAGTQIQQEFQSVIDNLKQQR
ncbi:MAG: alpha/beta hydrolase [Fuerstiella sp.]